MEKVKKGISLIVLVITIIVMIIIVGVIIISLTNSNIIGNANEGVFKSNIKSYQDELGLWIANEKSKDVKGFDIEAVNKTGEEMKEIITSMTTEDTEKFAIEKGKLVYLVSISETEKIWAQESGVVETQGPILPYQIANTAVTEGTLGTSLTVHSTINGQNPSYNNPVIPAGFQAVNTSEANWSNVATDWDKGLVIQDDLGNEFVWVPIDGTNVSYAKWCPTYNIAYNVAYNDIDISDDTFPSGLNETTLTNKYQGFYIARYESVFDFNGGSIRVASKKSINKRTSSWTRTVTYNGYLWNYITYTDAKKYSEAMDGAGDTGYYGYNYDTTKVGTNLVTGTQWDTVMKWIGTTTTNYTAKNISNSSDWGNYNNVTFIYDYPSPGGTKALNTSTLLNTGASSRNRAKNIYDLAGNAWEWTNEKYSTNFVYRGGCNSWNGTDAPAAFRYHYGPTLSVSSVGFRVSLYIL